MEKNCTTCRTWSDAEGCKSYINCTRGGYSMWNNKPADKKTAKVMIQIELEDEEIDNRYSYKFDRNETLIMHDGCIGCYYANRDTTAEPCKFCKMNCIPNTPYYDYIADFWRAEDDEIGEYDDDGYIGKTDTTEMTIEEIESELGINGLVIRGE